MFRMVLKALRWRCKGSLEDLRQQGRMPICQEGGWQPWLSVLACAMFSARLMRRIAESQIMVAMMRPRSVASGLAMGCGWWLSQTETKLTSNALPFCTVESSCSCFVRKELEAWVSHAGHARFDGGTGIVCDCSASLVTGERWRPMLSVGKGPAVCCGHCEPWRGMSSLPRNYQRTS